MRSRWCFALFLVALPALAEPLPLTLDDALQFALRDSVTVKNAYLDRIVTRFDTAVVRDEYLPRITLRGITGDSGTFVDDATGRVAAVSDYRSAAATLKLPTGGSIGVDLSTVGIRPETGVNDYDSALNLTLNQPLLRGGGMTAGTAPLIRARRANESNRLALRGQLISVAADVIRAWRAYALSLESLEIARLSLERSEGQVEINRELIDAGRLPSIELIQSETDVANQRLTVTTAENRSESLRIRLLRLLRLPLETELAIISSFEAEPIEISQQAALAGAMANRPDYLQSLIRLSNAELALEVAKNDAMWDLDLNARYAVSGSATEYLDSIDRVAPLDQGSYVVELSLEIPVSNLSRRQAKVTASAGLVQARNRHIDLEEQIRAEVADTLRTINVRWRQVDLAGRALELSRQQLELEQVKLNAGRSSNFQVVAFQNALVAAQNGYLLAQVDYLNAVTDLRSSMGTLLDERGLELKSDEVLGVNDIEDFGIEEG